MKFFSALKLAAHNLWTNKSRTILTIVIVFVVSTLIMTMLLLGTNFTANMNRANEMAFENNGTTYSLFNKSQNSNSATYSTIGEMVKIMEIAETAGEKQDTLKHANAVDSFYIKLGYNDMGAPEFDVNDQYYRGRGMGFVSCFFPLSKSDGSIIQGRIWTPSDEKENLVWVAESYVKEMSKNGVAIKVNDDIPFSFNFVSDVYRTQPGEPNKTFAFSKTLKVAGIFKGTERNSYDRPIEFFAPVKAVLPPEVMEFGKEGYNAMNISYTPVKGAFNYNEMEKAMTAFEKEVNSKIGKGTDWEGKQINRFSCSYLELTLMTRLMSVVIIGVLAILAFLILLLSIGSVANTIIISVDKNKKFIGLMMAMGLNNRGVKKIVHKEAIIQIALGVGLAILTIFLAKGLMVSLLNGMMGSLFASLAGVAEFKLSFTIAFYVPLGTLLVFILMALAFSKGALNKMGRADVISIISEVG